MEPHLTRRGILSMAGVAAAAAIAPPSPADEPPKPVNPAEPFGYCLNTSTLRGQNLPLTEEIDIAAKVGFKAIEPWLSEIDKHAKAGPLDDLRKRLTDAGLAVPSAIGFAAWIVDDDERRARGLEQMKRDMDSVAQIGGIRIAAPPVGANGPKDASPDLPKIAERYRAILDIGKQLGVTPQVELWGSSKTLSRLSEAVYVAVESGDPHACMLLDIYHLYKGGSDFNSLKLLSGSALGVLHTNDYPESPGRADINDSFRVYPGDGIAPLGELFRTLRDIHFRGYLSVELFNKEYWKQSPLKVAQAAIDKTRAAVQKALA